MTMYATEIYTKTVYNDQSLFIVRAKIKKFDKNLKILLLVILKNLWKYLRAH